MTAPVGMVPGTLIRYATPSSSGGHVGHLLPASWPKTRGRAKPALCGEPRIEWRPVDSFERPDVFRPCPDCTTAHPDAVAVVRAPVRIAPSYSGSAPVLAPTVPPQVNTQRSRTERRAAFRTQPVPIS